MKKEMSRFDEVDYWLRKIEEDPDPLVEDDLGIYGSKQRSESLDEDEIEPWEEAFMEGWAEA